MQVSNNAAGAPAQQLKRPKKTLPRPQGKLAELAQQICAEHIAATAAITTCAQHAMAAGDLLIKAKGHISHGQWGEFVESNCKISLRTAQTYMQMARDRATIESKAQSSAQLDLSIAGALKLISGPPKQSPKQKVQSSAHLTPPPKADEPRPEKAASHLELLEPWGRLPLEGRQRFFDAIGLQAILESIPKAWRGRIQQEYGEEPCQRQPRTTTRNGRLKIADNLSIPNFLSRPAPKKETVQ